MKNLGSINDTKSIVTKGYADNTYAQKSEVRSLTDTVSDLSDSLSSHTHTISDIQGLQSALDTKVTASVSGSVLVIS